MKQNELLELPKEISWSFLDYQSKFWSWYVNLDSR
jgi:hypothetical protein